MAKSKIDQKWTGDPFVEYQNKIEKSSVRPNFIARNISQAYKTQKIAASRNETNQTRFGIKNTIFDNTK